MKLIISGTKKKPEKCGSVCMCFFLSLIDHQMGTKLVDNYTNWGRERMRCVPKNGGVFVGIQILTHFFQNVTPLLENRGVNFFLDPFLRRDIDRRGRRVRTSLKLVLRLRLCHAFPLVENDFYRFLGYPICSYGYYNTKFRNASIWTKPHSKLRLFIPWSSCQQVT